MSSCDKCLNNECKDRNEFVKFCKDKFIFEDGFNKGVKSFAKFLIDKGIDGFEMSDLVKEFLEKGVDNG